MLNILIISNYSSEYGGNFIKSLQSLKNINTKSKLYNFYYIFPIGAANKRWIKNLQNTFFCDFSLLGWKNLFKKTLSELEINIIHFHFFDDVLDVYKCRAFVPKTTNIVFHFHLNILFKKNLKSYLKKIIYKIAYKNSTKLCVSKSVESDVKQFSSKNVITIYNKIDLSRLSIINNQKFIKNNNKCRLLIFGNDCITKGVDIAVKALRNINDKNIELYIAVNNDRTERLKKFIEPYINGIEKQVFIIPTREDIASYYTNINIFLSPSRHDAFPYSLTEALYCGCYVIASNIPGQNENKYNNICWIGNPNIQNIELELINAVIAYKSKCADIRSSIKDEIKKNEKIEDWANEILNIYEFIIK